MSRVEDEREAALVTARLLEQKRAEEAQKSRKVTENAKFSRLVAGDQAQARSASDRSVARSAIEQALEDEGHAEKESAQVGAGRKTGAQRDQHLRGALGAATKGERDSRSSHEESRHVEGEHLQAEGEVAHGAAQGQAKSAQSFKGTSGRELDARAGRDSLDARRADSEQSELGRAPGGRPGKEGQLKAGTDGGGQQGGGGGNDPSKDGGGGAMASSFRFNPALMAPVPVAQQRDTSGSERLRKVANELAQKIVERVRVGTNALGKAEFQVDFRQDVLSGLSVKVSAQNGKISAAFAGGDQKVLKLVEQQVELLKSALAGRGLTLESVKFEGRP